MSGENVVILIAAILAFIASLGAIYNTNFKRFTSERWWERKSRAYEDIVVSLSDLIHYYRTLIDEELSGKRLSKQTMEIINKRSKEGFDTIRRATDMGSFIISSEASEILQNYWKESDNRPDPQDWYAIFEDNYEKANKCLNGITVCARKDLRI